MAAMSKLNSLMGDTPKEQLDSLDQKLPLADKEIQREEEFLTQMPKADNFESISNVNPLEFSHIFQEDFMSNL